MQTGVFRVLGVSGDRFGGDDVDQLLAGYILEKSSNLGHKLSISQQQLLLLARHIKEELCNNSFVNKSIKNCDDGLFEFSISSEECDALIYPFIAKTVVITRKLLSEYPSFCLDAILLVGGSSKLPLIRRMLKKEFVDVKIKLDLDPDRIVAHGAARQAYNLTAQKSDLLLDVVPLSLGIELLDGLVDVFIPRNSAIPTHAMRLFTTHKDSQTGIQFNVVQG